MHMKYYFLYHYVKDERYLYLVALNSHVDIEKEFNKYLGKPHSGSILITDLNTIKEFRGSQY